MNSKGTRSREVKVKGREGEMERYRERRGNTGQPPLTEEGEGSKEELSMSSRPKAQKTWVGKEPMIDQRPHLAS